MRLLPLDVAALRACLDQGPAFWVARGVLAADEELPPRFLLEHCLAMGLAHPDRAWWAQLWLMVDESGHLMGSLAFKGLDVATGTAEIGYGVAATYRGRGLATEAVSRLIAQAGAHPEVRKIVAQVQPGNLASRRVVEKCGFVEAGEAFDADEGRVLLYEKLPSAGYAGRDRRT